MSVPTALMTVASMQPAPTQRAALSAHVIKDTLVMGKLAEVNTLIDCMCIDRVQLLFHV